MVQRPHNNTATGSHFDVPQEDNFMEDCRSKMGWQSRMRSPVEEWTDRPKQIGITHKM